MTGTKITRAHHIGIPVSDLQRSLDWYTKVLGLIDTGITTGGSGPVIDQALRTEGAVIVGAFLRIGDQIVVELLHYTSPEPRPYELRNGDVGSLHIGFQVDDIWAAYHALSGAGVEFNSEPIKMEGPEARSLDGYSFVYFRDPDGIPMELFEIPPGREF